ncbi:BMC domain-containing protein [Klebsiella indica]|uniref:BMC domain-containing protein n=1 Tax=Klebsiella indica TaxID=2582917 RepID=A0A5R9LGR3_9ENTR|nr:MULTISPECIES: BMC domain-containing protein [Klebsiella]TLV16743.1 BMC domain-containing protein [Klebsiella indica]
MAGQSLGLIETVGLTVAIEAADAAMKSANVDLIGYELTKGGGLVTVKLTGEIGAMNAAVSAGVAAANNVGSVYAWKVIARTATGIDELIASKETQGVAPQEPVKSVEAMKPVDQSSTPVEENKEAIIPVVNVEPDEIISDCLAQEENVVTDMADTVSPQPESELTQSGVEAVPASLLITEKAEKTANDNKKPLRARVKSTRR